MVDQNDNRLLVWPDTHLVCLPLGTPEIQRNIVTGPCTKAIEFAVSWRAGRTIWVFGCKSFLCPCVLHCIYGSSQCMTIHKNITRILLQLQVDGNKLNFVVVSLTKLLFGHFSSLTKLWSVQTPRLEPPDATNTSASTGGHQVPKLLQKASDEQSGQILKSTVGVYTVWHIDADDFT